MGKSKIMLVDSIEPCCDCNEYKVGFILKECFTVFVCPKCNNIIYPKGFPFKKFERKVKCNREYPIFIYDENDIRLFHIDGISMLVTDSELIKEISGGSFNE